MKQKKKFIGRFDINDEDYDYTPDPTPALMTHEAEYRAIPKTGAIGVKDVCWHCPMLTDCQGRIATSDILWLACEIPDELDIAMLAADQTNRSM